jgi:hypothetical protein
MEKGNFKGISHENGIIEKENPFTEFLEFSMKARIMKI